MNGGNGILRFICSSFILWFLAAPAAHALPELAIEVNPDPVRPGETMRVALTVSNTVGGGTLSNVQIQMRIPQAGLVSFVLESFVSHGGDCLSNTCDADEFVTWSVGNLAVGTSRTVTLPLTVLSNPAPADGTIIPIEGTVLVGGVLGDTETKDVVVDAGRALELGVDENADPVQPSGALTYRLSFGNRGLVTVTGSSLRFPLPAGVTF